MSFPVVSLAAREASQQDYLGSYFMKLFDEQEVESHANRTPEGTWLGRPRIINISSAAPSQCFLAFLCQFVSIAAPRLALRVCFDSGLAVNSKPEARLRGALQTVTGPLPARCCRDEGKAY